MAEFHDPFSLAGRTILVTGASSGIGRSVAVECARRGACLVLVARNEERLAETMSMLKPGEHLTFSADLSEVTQRENLVAELPKLDGAVLCAGIAQMKPVSFASQSFFESIYGTNLYAPADLLRLIVKKKTFNPGFSAVMISSVAGSTDFVPGNSVYGSGKAALSSFARYAALEFASKKIRVNTVSPGMIMTPMHTGGEFDAEALESVAARIPLRRWGEPSDVAYACCYLLSDAAAYVTGSDITVDGGLTI